MIIRRLCIVSLIRQQWNASKCAVMVCTFPQVAKRPKLSTSEAPPGVKAEPGPAETLAPSTGLSATPADDDLYLQLDLEALVQQLIHDKVCHRAAIMHTACNICVAPDHNVVLPYTNRGEHVGQSCSMLWTSVSTPHHKLVSKHRLGCRFGWQKRRSDWIAKRLGWPQSGSNSTHANHAWQIRRRTCSCLQQRMFENGAR